MLNKDDFHVKVAETLEDACKLLETGFEYITDMEGKNYSENESRKLSGNFQILWVIRISHA
jgi:hypothetical protein